MESRNNRRFLGEKVQARLQWGHFSSSRGPYQGLIRRQSRDAPENIGNRNSSVLTEAIVSTSGLRSPLLYLTTVASEVRPSEGTDRATDVIPASIWMNRSHFTAVHNFFVSPVMRPEY